MTSCTVCKGIKPSEEPGSKGIKDENVGWSVTSERLATSQVQILFKLYEILKREFPVGYICEECRSLLDQADCLQFQLHAVTRALKDRIDKNCEVFSKETEYAEGRPGFKAKYKALREAKYAGIRDCTKETLERVPVTIEEGERNLPAFEEKRDVSGVIAEIRQNFTVSGLSKRKEFKLNMTFWANINDAEYVKKCLVKNDFDDNCSVFLGSRSSETLLFDGYMWDRDINHKIRKTSALVNCWRCKEFRPKEKGGVYCKSRIATLIDDSAVLLDSVEIEHNHPRNDEVVKTEVFRVKLKEMAAAHPTMNPTQIVSSCELLYGKEYSVTFAALVKWVSGLQRRMGAPQKPYSRTNPEPVPKKARLVTAGQPPFEQDFYLRQ